MAGSLRPSGGEAFEWRRCLSTARWLFVSAVHGLVGHSIHRAAADSVSATLVRHQPGLPRVHVALGMAIDRWRAFGRRSGHQQQRTSYLLSWPRLQCPLRPKWDCPSADRYRDRRFALVRLLVLVKESRMVGRQLFRIGGRDEMHRSSLVSLSVVEAEVESGSLANGHCC